MRGLWSLVPHNEASSGAGLIIWQLGGPWMRLPVVQTSGERKTERGEKVRGMVTGSDREIRTVGWWGSERSAVTVVRHDRGRKTDYGN